MLTLPNLMSNYKKKVYVAQLQKTYNQFENAFSNYKADNELDEFEDLTNADAIENFVKKYFKITRWCGKKPVGCMADKYYANDLKTVELVGYCTSAPARSFKTNSGSAICIVTPENSDKTSIYIDVNGPQKPNIAGRDFFSFDLKADKGIVTWYVDSSEDVIANAKESCLGSGTPTALCMYYFSYKIISDGWIMDY